MIQGLDSHPSNVDLPGLGDDTSLGQAGRPRVLKINLADLNVEGGTTVATSRGKEYSARGKILSMNSDSASQGGLVVSIDEGDESFRFRRGTKVRCRLPFSRVSVFRSVSSQITGLVYMDVTWEDADITYAIDNVNVASAAGSPFFLTTVYDNAGAGLAGITNVAPARTSRWRAQIKNEGAVDVLIVSANTLANGRILPPGDALDCPTVADVWALPVGAGFAKVTTLEFYS